jgi:single-strand DNA-binding protein
VFNEAHVSLAGYVVGEPRYLKVGQGQVPKLTVRVCWTTRRWDSATGGFVDGNTSFVDVICWRQLAENASTCLRRGDCVVAKGRLDIRSFTGRDGQRRTVVEVEASALGPDLSRGVVAGYRRIWSPAGRTAERHEVAGQADDGGDAVVDDEAAATAAAEAELVPEAEGPADEEVFDDSAIDALAPETDSVTAPF